MRKHPRGGLLTSAVASVAAAIALALSATPSIASTARTWTVKPGGTFSGDGKDVAIGDATTGATFTCRSSHMAGKLKSGRGLANPIGKITSVTFRTCTGPGGPSFTVTTSASVTHPWPMDGISFSGGVVHGKIAKVRINISGDGCTATLAGQTATSPGTVVFTYGSDILKISGGTLHVWNVSTGCLGLFNPGDGGVYAGNYKITPAQAITSP